MYTWLCCHQKEGEMIFGVEILTFLIQTQQDLLEISKEQKEGYNKYSF